jgi:subtilisin family serine protease
MLRIKLLLLLLLFTSQVINAQISRYGLGLKLLIEEKGERSDEVIDLCVEGDVEELRSLRATHQFKIKHQLGNLLFIRIPISEIIPLSQQPTVSNIIYDHFPGQLLGDTMLLRNNVLPIINREAPFVDEIKGKGILMGFVDSGIDYNHPDFRDEEGNSRIIAIWDQTQSDNAPNTPQKYGYGRVWTNQDIQNETIDHDDQPQYWGHGSNVTGIAAGNGFGIMKNEALLNELRVTGKVGEDFQGFRGVAPDVYIAAVSSNFTRPNWTMTVADAVDFLFDLADSLDVPCVINTSLGTYLGSHDGRDPAGLFIDSLVTAKKGRAVVAAVGNSGHHKYHAGYEVTADTSFTWLKVNSSSQFGFPAVFFDLWTEKDQLENVSFAMGADDTGFNFRGRTNFISVSDLIDNYLMDSIYVDGNRIARVEYYLGEMNGLYRLQVMLASPDSLNYNYRFMTTGQGRVDFWSGEWLGLSRMLLKSELPSSIPNLEHYQSPDSLMSMVSSWACSPHVITVANYQNKTQFVDFNGNITTVSGMAENLASNSSHGPSRDARLKPDIAATGGTTLTAARLKTVESLIATSPDRVAPGGLHSLNGGSSMAAPVVAGAIALYLEHCPEADIDEIMTDLFENTKKDHFTGETPNTSWGFGKVDISATIERAYFKPSILINGDLAFCEDEEVRLELESGFSSYLWNDESTVTNRNINFSGDFYATVINENGCIGKTDTISVTAYPIPETPVINSYVNSNAMVTGNYDSYQWYLNGNLIEDSNSQSFIAQESGYYKVRVDNSYGCSRYSEEIAFNLKTEINDLAGFYPNPVVDHANLIILQEAENIYYQVIDLSGRIILNEKIENPGRYSSHIINLSGLSGGIYYFNVSSEDKTKTIRFLKVD